MNVYVVVSYDKYSEDVKEEICGAFSTKIDAADQCKLSNDWSVKNSESIFYKVKVVSLDQFWS